MAVVPEPPKSYADPLVALPDDFHPYGPECSLHRDVQTAAFHHGLSKIHVEALIDFGFDTVVSFRGCNHSGAKHEKEMFKFVLALYTSPLVQTKVAWLVTRLNSADIAAALPPELPAAAIPAFALSTPVGRLMPDNMYPDPPKKSRIATTAAASGASGAVTGSVVAAAPGAASSSSSSNPGVSSGSGVVPGLGVPSSSGVTPASGAKTNAAKESSDSDSSSDSDGGAGASSKTEKSSDKRGAKDANSMVEDIGNEVRLPLGSLLVKLGLPVCSNCVLYSLCGSRFVMHFGCLLPCVCAVAMDAVNFEIFYLMSAPSLFCTAVMGCRFP